ncbi:MAG TPA: hypothetical protein VN667_15545 [Burkholderiales bacterium]|nr:hypothetical protein [Burkholderiales bacterium]
MKLREHEYGLFRRLLPRTSRLPPEWALWENARRHADLFYVSMGGRVEEVEVRFAQFAAHCADTRALPTLETLREFAHSQSASCGPPAAEGLETVNRTRTQT